MTLSSDAMAVSPAAMDALTLSGELERMSVWLGRHLSRERLAHSRGACEKAQELARQFSLPEGVVAQVAVGALLHDCAKWMTLTELLQYCDAYDLALTDADRACPQTLHALVGADLAARELGVQDPQVLDAIAAHTTGRNAMGIVETLVFIADKIEGNARNPLYVRKITEKLDGRNPRSLDVAMLFLLDATIAFLLEKRHTIHPRAIEARNGLLARMNDERGVPTGGGAPRKQPAT